jgi:hypothetical protein
MSWRCFIIADSRRRISLLVDWIACSVIGSAGEDGVAGTFRGVAILRFNGVCAGVSVVDAFSETPSALLLMLTGG